MSRVRIAFMGTPEFAAVALRALLQDSHYEVVGVITQPDRPSGRKLQLTPSPVKILAEQNHIPVLTPESLKKELHYYETVKEWKAEVGVVVAFGQILTQEFLNLFPYGCVNLHGSLLPLWRGAAPIQRAIEAGDVESGVALQKMVKKLDAGDVLGVRKLSIAHLDAQQLHDELARLGTELLHIEMMDYIRGNLSGLPQDESKVTYAKKIEKSEALLDWNKSAVELHNKVRAFVMGPGTFFQWNGKKFKVHKSAVVNNQRSAAGVVSEVDAQRICVGTSHGEFCIYEIQPESRNRMTASDFLKAHPLKVGDRLI